MAFVTGLFLIDAPASALNNLGNVEGRLFDNVAGVKVIRTKEGSYPYVSAQAFRYWLRTTIERVNPDWKPAPIWRETKIAYTDANPIRYWDDDLFGYMRAPSKKASAVKERETDENRIGETPIIETVTRSSPFRVSTLVSIAPTSIIEDWETMSRHEGDPVPYSSQFYRTTLKGLFSLDLKSCGTFWYRQKTGFLNLDKERIKEAKEAKLEELIDKKAFRLPLNERIKRISALFEGMVNLEGGAKLALHYTDVSPVICVMAVTKGGNHIFNHIFGANAKGLPDLKIDALGELLNVFKEEILSDIYFGWTKGYLEGEREKLESFCDNNKEEFSKLTETSHPREAFKGLITALKDEKNRSWLD
ncbi:MAG: type I-B CRISPR-associated protein Cas7/Cst2/DevR [Pseudomonadota bacterium]|jgi:CRISPR-associated protein Cst2|nr:type I-B CRISPR-associated protein Cas7/Cst2/DevR [Pseudomonadota bacterium]